jgi:tetratricopeptide (TPR) repeat protein
VTERKGKVRRERSTSRSWLFGLLLLAATIIAYSPALNLAAEISILVQRYAAQNRLLVYGVPGLLLLNLATLTSRQAGTYRDAHTLYQTTLQRNPSAWMAHNNLGIELYQEGQLAEAIAHYQEAIAIEPGNAESYTNLGNAYMVQGRANDALQQYERTLVLAPRAVQAKNNLAWLLATARDASLRDPPRALKLAEEAVEISESEDLVVLRTLAAAYARNGRFTEATAVAEKGLQLAADNAAFAGKLREDAKAYQAHVALPH